MVRSIARRSKRGQPRSPEVTKTAMAVEAGTILRGGGAYWHAALDTAVAQLPSDQRDLVKDVLAAAGAGDEHATRLVRRLIEELTTTDLEQAASYGIDRLYEEASALDDEDQDGVAEAFDDAAQMGSGRQAEQSADAAEQRRLIRQRHHGEGLVGDSADRAVVGKAERVCEALIELGKDWARVRAAYRNSKTRWAKEAVHRASIRSGRKIRLASTVEGRAILRGEIPPDWKGQFTIAQHPAWPPWPESELVPDEPCQQEHEYSYCAGCRLWIPPPRNTCPSCEKGNPGPLPPPQKLSVPHRHCTTCGMAEVEAGRRFITPVARVNIKTFERTHLGWACGGDERGCRSALLKRARAEANAQASQNP